MLSEQVEYQRRNKDMVKPSPFRCFHPKRIYNKYLNEYLYVNCRECDGCLSARSAELTSRVNNECKQHKYSIFFTLTYDNEHLPVMKFHSGTLFLGSSPIDRDSKTGNYIYPSFDSSSIDDFDVYGLTPTSYNDELTFAYVNKYDVQKFLMRLRSHLYRGVEFRYSKSSDGSIVRKLENVEYLKNVSKDERKIRYFICSEYGPSYFRPHYHGILWCDSQPVARYLERNILEDWSLGSKTLDSPSYVQGNAASYVAKYVNGSTRLPKVLQSKQFHTFVIASKNPIVGSYKDDLLQITDALINGVVEQLQPIDSRKPTELAFIPISPYLCSRYFPKCQGFNINDDFGKLQVLFKYDKSNYRKEFVYDVDKDKYVFKNSYLYGLDYINSLGFKYQDYRFYVQAKFWTSKPIAYPERINGLKTGRILHKTLSLDEYIRCINRLYSNLSLLVLRGFYLSQEMIMSSSDPFYNRLICLFGYYPNIFYELPYAMSEEEWNESDFDYFFSTFDFGYKAFYEDGWLNLDLINYVTNNSYVTSYRSKISFKIEDSLKNKKYNEFIHEL